MVDVSRSMSPEELEIQRRGYAEALASDEVVGVIQNGFLGRIAVTYVEWAGYGLQRVILPWTQIDGREAAEAAAAQLTADFSHSMRRTSISGAIDFARQDLRTNAFEGLRKVIDISGDGPNNDGGPVEAARDHAVADGVIINGLAIQLADRRGQYTYFDLPDLDRYYKDCVIGGPGAFVLPITHSREFATAIRQTLLLEIAALEPVARPRVHRVQLAEQSAKYDCLIGEKLWRQYQRDRGSEW